MARTLEERLAAAEATIAALKRRVEQKVAAGESAFAAVEQSVALERLVVQRTSALAQKQAELEEALRRNRESNLLLALAQEVSHTGSWVWNTVTGEVERSAEYSRMLGLEPVGASTTTDAEMQFIHADDRARVAEVVDRTLHERGEFEMEYRIRRKDGQVRVVFARGRVLVESGAQLKMLGTRQDITELKEMQARLAIADRMAAVGTLAAGVAHELNNPLSYVTANLAWCIETLQKVPSGLSELASRDSRLAEALVEARSGADRMRDIIRDLGTFWRRDAERLGAVEIGAVLESCVNMTWKEIRARAMLVRELQPTARVYGNDAKLGQVFVNLLLNATQALPEGTADRNRIRIATRTLADGRVVVEIGDTGCGIPAEVRSRVFDPFFTTKGPGRGTGLGLSICHNIVTSIGGSIEVESDVGRGSTFRVFLQPWRGPAESPAGAPARTRVHRGGGRVLVVDDELQVGNALRRALSREHEVTVVGSAREALALIEGGRDFDLVVSDLLMPEMSGIDLAAELERRRPALAARMIFLTGGASGGLARDFVEAHRSSCLEKPFDLEVLRDLVSRRITGGPERAAREDASPPNPGER